MKLIALAFAFVSTFANAALPPIQPSLPIEQCAKHLPYGTPTTGRQDTTMICREGYVLEYDNKLRIPLWVAYRLTPEHVLGCYPRVAKFRIDPTLPAEVQASLKAYSKSGFDIGHYANDNNMRYDPVAEQESNLFPNSAPQVPGLNRGGWAMLEAQTNSWVTNRQHDVIVYIGTVMNHQTFKTLKDEGIVPIPTAFTKVLVDDVTHEVLSFEYPNVATGEQPRTFLTSLPKVQQDTTVVFPLPHAPTWSTEVWPIVTKSARAAKQNVCAVKF